MRFLFTVMTLAATSPSWAINDSHNRCDKLAIEELSQLQKALCKGKLKNTEECIEIERDIVEYLTAFHSRNNAFCVRFHEKYNLVLIPAYKRNPDRVL